MNLMWSQWYGSFIICFLIFLCLECFGYFIYLLLQYETRRIYGISPRTIYCRLLLHSVMNMFDGEVDVFIGSVQSFPNFLHLIIHTIMQKIIRSNLMIKLTSNGIFPGIIYRENCLSPREKSGLSECPHIKQISLDFLLNFIID
uniref:Uncharacterized protein n=1 Tax=Heterorhabditis bacteriophora TaxID=37862 RepID=A0A1I7WGE4_HETBA